MFKMKLKKVIVVNSFALVLLFIFSLSMFVNAQTYDVIEVVEPGGHLVYQTTYPPEELGTGWSNHLEFSLETNVSSVEVYWITALGYTEFLQNENLNDVNVSNIIEEVHFDSVAMFSRTIWTQDISILYTIINNTGTLNAEWNIIIDPLSNYHDPTSTFIPGYPLFLMVIFGVISIFLIIKKIRK